MSPRREKRQNMGVTNRQRCARPKSKPLIPHGRHEGTSSARRRHKRLYTAKMCQRFSSFRVKPERKVCYFGLFEVFDLIPRPKEKSTGIVPFCIVNIFVRNAMLFAMHRCAASKLICNQELITVNILIPLIARFMRCQIYSAVQCSLCSHIR